MKDTEKCARCHKKFEPGKLRWRSDPDIWSKPPAPSRWRDGRYCVECFDAVNAELVAYFQKHPPAIQSL